MSEVLEKRRCVLFTFIALLIMCHPKDLLIKDFSYVLPEERIAKYPNENRDESKLLIYKNGLVEEDIFFNIEKYLDSESLLVFNDTKVVEARLLFTKSTDTVIEIFCLGPDDNYPDVTTAMVSKEKVIWKCLIGGAKKWKEDAITKKINSQVEEITLTARKIDRREDYFLVEFTWSEPSLTFSEVLHLAGEVPLPPYLNRPTEISDKERYQTVYAKQEGSVAAPTAGLHFTKRLLDKLAAKKIKKDFVTLHVGAGTFKPVKNERIEEHEMHAEFIDVKKSLIDNLISNTAKDIIAVGTTSLRTIESLYWLGTKIVRKPRISLEELFLSQWEVYEPLKEDITSLQSLAALSAWMKENNLERLITKTQIIIAPPYQLKIAKGLITNLHQPKSTLLLLVAAIAGSNWKNIYNYALDNYFRFLSYGDACLIYP